MVIGQIDKAPLKPMEPLPSDSQEKVKHSKGQTLDQVFGKEVLNETISLVEELPSFWDKLLNWWSPSDTPVEAKKSDAIAEGPKGISSLPVLEAPESLSPLLEALPPAPAVKSRPSSSKLSESRIMEGLSLMSSKTVEEVMYIVLQGQLALEKENAAVAEGTFNHYQEMKKLHDKILQEVKDALAKDERVAGYFKTGQNIALAASFLCSAVSIAVTFGLAATCPPAAAGILIALSTYAPVVAGSLAVLTTGGKAYFKRRSSEGQSKQEEMNHFNSYANGLVDEARDRLGSIAETESVFKDRMALMFKRLQKMRQLMAQRT